MRSQSNHSKSNTHHCDSLWSLKPQLSPTQPFRCSRTPSSISPVALWLVISLPEKYARQSGSSSQIISQMGLLSKKIFESTNQRWIGEYWLYISPVYPHYIPILESLHIRVELNKECLTPPTSKNHRSMDNGLNPREHLQETMDFPMKSWFFL